MNFEVFSKTEIEDMYRSIVSNMNEEQKAIFIEHHGSMEAFQKYFMENATSKAAQKNFQEVVEWYGSKKSALEASKNPRNSEVFPAYQIQLESVLEKLAKKRDLDVHSLEIKELVKEYDFVSRQLYQMEDVTKMLLELAELYQTNGEIQKVQDSIYGEDSTMFFGKAIEAFYQNDSISNK